jgi:hypothetical protein
VGVGSTAQLGARARPKVLALFLAKLPEIAA